MKIVVLERNSVGTDIDVSAFERFGEVEYYANTYRPEDVAERTADADIIIANKAPMNRQTLAGSKKVRYIGEFATGYDNIDLEYCKERGIRVCNVVNYSTAMVAQTTITLALALTMKLVHYDNYVKSGEYASQERFSNFDVPFNELDGKTWGIVGMGNIGSRVAKVASALGCRVITASVTGRKRDTGYEQVGKETLLKESDIISLHCPLTDLSRRYIDAGAFEMMKKTAILINVARGPVVDNLALYEALRDGKIAAAGLDVLEKEPLSKDDPLGLIKDSGKLIITPHLAWASVEARTRCVEENVLNLEAFLEGRSRCVVC